MTTRRTTERANGPFNIAALRRAVLAGLPQHFTRNQMLSAGHFLGVWDSDDATITGEVQQLTERLYHAQVGTSPILNECLFYLQMPAQHPTEERTMYFSEFHSYMLAYCAISTDCDRMPVPRDLVEFYAVLHEQVTTFMTNVLGDSDECHIVPSGN